MPAGISNEFEGPVGEDEIKRVVDKLTVFNPDAVGMALRMFQGEELLGHVTGVLPSWGDLSGESKRVPNAVTEAREAGLQLPVRSLYEELSRRSLETNFVEDTLAALEILGNSSRAIQKGDQGKIDFNFAPLIAGFFPDRVE